VSDPQDPQKPDANPLPPGYKILKMASNVRSWDNMTHYLLGLELDDSIIVIPLGPVQMKELKDDVDKWIEDHGDQPVQKARTH